jgi:hypothetical protein
MACGTGLIVGLITPFVYFGGAVGLIVGFSASQFIVYRYFIGSSRGHFEYTYLEHINDNAVYNLIQFHFGVLSLIRYRLDDFNNIGYYQLSLCKALIKSHTLKLSLDDRLVLLIKIASLNLKDDNLKGEINFLSQALEIKEYDLVANYRLAIACEKEGLANKAIDHYQRALRSELTVSDQLRAFIHQQADRVKAQGPMAKPPTLGLRFSSW